MANLPPTSTFGQYLITIDDGSGTNQVAPCGFLKKSVKFDASTSETIVPDCTNPDLAAFVERNVVSLSVSVDGSGVLAMENTGLWAGFYFGAVSRPCVINLNVAGSLGGFTVTGNFILSSWSHDASKKDEAGRTQQAVTLMSDGLLTYTANPG